MYGPFVNRNHMASWLVMALPFASTRLLRAVADDRSAAQLAAAVRPVLDRAAASGNRATVLGVAAYPPSLPFYLNTTVDVATADAGELTSNYIAAFQDRYRGMPNSPLHRPEFWKLAAARCAAPTVFVVASGNRAARNDLAALPLLSDDNRYVAYGPCEGAR